MQPVLEIDQIAPGISIWQIYDAAVKADLFSTALESNGGLCLVDPIPLDPIAFENFSFPPVSIFITNINHARACTEFGQRFSVPIFAHHALLDHEDFPTFLGVEDGAVFAPQLTAIALPGGPAGEMALYYDRDGGTMVMGDALINFEPQGFAPLPAKYCIDVKMLHRSLHKLLDYSFDRMLFAHGMPILSQARVRLEQVLAKG